MAIDDDVLTSGTYNPLRMGRNLERMVLKSGRSSGTSLQHSFIEEQTQSIQFSSSSTLGLNEPIKGWIRPTALEGIAGMDFLIG